MRHFRAIAQDLAALKPVAPHTVWLALGLLRLAVAGCLLLHESSSLSRKRLRTREDGKWERCRVWTQWTLLFPHVSLKLNDNYVPRNKLYFYVKQYADSTMYLRFPCVFLSSVSSFHCACTATNPTRKYAKTKRAKADGTNTRDNQRREEDDEEKAEDLLRRTADLTSPGYGKTLLI